MPNILTPGTTEANPLVSDRLMVHSCIMVLYSRTDLDMLSTLIAMTGVVPKPSPLSGKEAKSTRQARLPDTTEHAGTDK